MIGRRKQKRKKRGSETKRRRSGGRGIGAERQAEASRAPFLVGSIGFGEKF